MNVAKDGEGFYAKHIVGMRPNYRADLENCLAGVLRSPQKAAEIMGRVFGNAEVRHVGGSSHALRLWLMEPNEFGLSAAQQEALRGALGIGKMMYAMQHETKEICEPEQAAGYFANRIGWQTTEYFAVLAVNVKHEAIGFEVIAQGTLTETLAHPREIFQSALRWGASRIFVGHNHPSGNNEASPEDIILTRQLLQAAQILGIPVMDYIIVSGNDWRSIHSESSLWEELPQI
jgi:DNA repair protein RadC